MYRLQQSQYGVSTASPAQTKPNLAPDAAAAAPEHSTGQWPGPLLPSEVSIYTFGLNVVFTNSPGVNCKTDNSLWYLIFIF